MAASPANTALLEKVDAFVRAEMEREKAPSALGITKGARLMLSTPPAIIRLASPDLMARAAVPIASIPDPHRRLMVAPGTESGKPASSKDMRATFRLSSPAWLAQPRITSSMCCGSTPERSTG